MKRVPSLLLMLSILLFGFACGGGGSDMSSSRDQLTGDTITQPEGPESREGTSGPNSGSRTLVDPGGYGQGGPVPDAPDLKAIRAGAELDQDHAETVTIAGYSVNVYKLSLPEDESSMEHSVSFDGFRVNLDRQGRIVIDEGDFDSSSRSSSEDPYLFLLEYVDTPLRLRSAEFFRVSEENGVNFALERNGYTHILSKTFPDRPESNDSRITAVRLSG